MTATFTFTGRVLDKAKRPVRRAKLVLTSTPDVLGDETAHETYTREPAVTTDDSGYLCRVVNGEPDDLPGIELVIGAQYSIRDTTDGSVLPLTVFNPPVSGSTLDLSELEPVPADLPATWATMLAALALRVTDLEQEGIGLSPDPIDFVDDAGDAWTLSADHTVTDATLTEDCTFAMPEDYVPMTHTVFVRQDAAGGWMPTFTDVVWPFDNGMPPIDTDPNAVTILTFFTEDDGLSWYGMGHTQITLTGHHAQHEPGGADAFDFTTIHRRGPLSSRPAASTSLSGILYYANDDRGGTLYRCRNTTWDQVGPSLRRQLAATGFIRTNIDRASAVFSNLASALTAGRLTMIAVELQEGDVVTGCTIQNGTTAGAGLTHRWAALFDKDRNRLAVGADDTTATTSASSSLSFVIPSTTITVPGTYYIGILFAGTTVPSLVGLNTNSSITQLAPATVGLADTGLTTPATCPTTAAAFSASGSVPYIGVS